MKFEMALFVLGLKRPGRESNRSPPSDTEIKEAWRNTGHY
jgi:hypothetical protein